MKRLIQIVALLLALGAVAFWAARGAHRGWTQTRVMEKTVDEVTGQDIVAWKDRFVPGVDFLGGALLGAGFLAGASLLFRSQNKTKNQNNSPA